MIETQEQYEEWREAVEKFPNLRMWPKDMRAIVETIEALREVAKEAQLASEINFRGVRAEYFWTLNALPEWLLEE